MTKQRNKAELLRDTQVERRRLDKVLADLPKQVMTQPGVIGEWSVKDILAHLVAWEQLFLSWYESGSQKIVPDTKPVGMSTQAIDALNQQIFERYSQFTLEDVLANYQDSYKRIFAVMQAIQEEDMFTVGRYAWTGELTLADYLAANTCNHYYWAKTKIRAWLKAQQRQ